MRGTKGRNPGHSPAPSAERGRDGAALAAFYDREWRDEGATQPYRAFWRFPGSAYQGLEALLGPVAGRRLLELGPGNGITTVRFARRGASVVAAELSPVGLRALVARAARAGIPTPAGQPAVGARIMPLRADAQRLPLADASVDLIAGENILMHVDPAALAPECRRVLRPGGCAVFLEPTAHHPLVRLYRRFRSPYRATAPHHVVLDDLPRVAAPFAQATHQEFYLLAVLALPFAARPFLFALAFRLLDALDRGLFRLFPALRRYGWLTVIALRA